MESFEAGMELVEKGVVQDGFPRPRRAPKDVIARIERLTGVCPMSVNREVELPHLQPLADSARMEIEAAGNAKFEATQWAYGDGSGRCGMLVVTESVDAPKEKYEVLIVRAGVPFPSSMVRVGSFGSRNSGMHHVHVRRLA